MGDGRGKLLRGRDPARLLSIRALWKSILSQLAPVHMWVGGGVRTLRFSKQFRLAPQQKVELGLGEAESQGQSRPEHQI